MRKLILMLLLLISIPMPAQKAKIGFSLTYDLYASLDEIPGIQSSWRTLYVYNPSLSYYDINYRYWPYDQLNMDFSFQIGSDNLHMEPVWSFTLIKGWYSVVYDDGKYLADDPILYLPASDDNPLFFNGEDFLYARGSGRMGQRRLGFNLVLGDEFQIGTGIWWQKQKIELHKSLAYNRYWYNAAYSKPGFDGYETFDDEVYVYEPTVETVYNKRIIFPFILRYFNGPFSSHVTFIFQKPFQLLVGSGFYF